MGFKILTRYFKMSQDTLVTGEEESLPERSSSCADGGGNDIHYRPHLFDLGNSKQIPIVDGGIPFLTCSFLVISSIISIQFRLASTELLFDIFFE